MTAVAFVLLIPTLAVVALAFVSNYRRGAAINVAASALTFLAGLSLLFGERGEHM